MKALPKTLCSALLLGISFLGLSACDYVSNQQKTETKIAGKTMGTFYNITVVGEYPGGPEQLQHDSEKVLSAIVNDISTFNKKSVLSKFNQTHSTEPMEISHNLADIIITCLRVGHDLGGAMDITVGPLVNAWGFGPKKNGNKFPTDEEIAAAKANVGLDKIHVEIGYEKSFIRKDNPNVYVDLSTVGEGFGADKIAEMLDARGITDYMVSIAGAIRTRGSNSRGKDWVIAIEDPANDQNVGQNMTTTVCTKGQAISTAGSYRNYRIGPDGKRESHIINPVTGRPVDNNTVSVTVIGPSALWTDALDTGMVVMGYENALKYANERNIAIYAIAQGKNGFEVHSSRAMEQYLNCK